MDSAKRLLSILPMKVVRFYPPGGPEKLKYQDETVPSPGPGQVLIKIHSVGLIWPELTWPIYQDRDGTWISHIPGHDYSGVIEKVGNDCEDSNLRVGSEIYGFTSRRNHEGGMAEYALADKDQVVLKPRNLSFSEAAAVPLSALTAWQAIHDHASLASGNKFLVTGAAGGTGIFAVQIAKAIGAYVIATASADKSRELLEGFGVDEIIDYKLVDIEKAIQDVDVVFDCVGGRVFEQCLKVVKPDGLLVSISTFEAEAQGRAADRKAVFFIVSMDAKQLNQISQMLEEKELKPVIDSVYPLERTREAFEYAAGGHVHGKVVITVPK